MTSLHSTILKYFHEVYFDSKFVFWFFLQNENIFMYYDYRWRECSAKQHTYGMNMYGMILYTKCLQKYTIVQNKLYEICIWQKKFIKIFSFWNVGLLKSQECFKRISHEIQIKSCLFLLNRKWLFLFLILFTLNYFNLDFYVSPRLQNFTSFIKISLLQLFLYLILLKL